MRKIIGTLVALTLVVGGCADSRDYYVSKLGHDEETGRYYVRCAHPSKPMIEYTITQFTATRTKVGEPCYGEWIREGFIVSPASSSTQPGTT